MKNVRFHCALTVDVEDGVSIAMRDYFNVKMPPTERVVTNTGILLDLFSKNLVKGTFFIVGEVAERYPLLVKKIATEGHEVGMHGYTHTQYFKLSCKELEKEIRDTKVLLEDLTGKKVLGHRAPAFSINPSPFPYRVLEILEQLGLTYDSSVVPTLTRHYGWPGFRRDISKVTLPNGRAIIEAPLSVVDVLGTTIPACGGGYLRLFPFWFTRYCFKAILNLRPAILYMHPYEIDTIRYPDFFQEAAAHAPLKKRMKVLTLGVNKGKVLDKINRLLKEFEFMPLADLISRKLGNEQSMRRAMDGKDVFPA